MKTTKTKKLLKGTWKIKSESPTIGHSESAVVQIIEALAQSLLKSVRMDFSTRLYQIVTSDHQRDILKEFDASRRAVLGRIHNKGVKVISNDK